MKESPFSLKRIKTELRRNYNKYLVAAVALLGLSLAGCSASQIEADRVQQINTVEAAGIMPDLPVDCQGSAVRLSLSNKSSSEVNPTNLKPSGVVVRRMQVAGPNGTIYNKIILLTAQHAISPLTDPAHGYDAQLDSVLVETQVNGQPKTSTLVDLVGAKQVTDDQGSPIDMSILTVLDTQNVLPESIQPVKNIVPWQPDTSSIHLAHYPYQAGVETMLVSQLDMSTMRLNYAVEDYIGQEYYTFDVAPNSAYIDGGTSGSMGCTTSVSYPDGALTFITTNKLHYNPLKAILKSVPASIQSQIEMQVNTTPYNSLLPSN